jgi:hypothetical protein
LHRLPFWDEILTFSHFMGIIHVGEVRRGLNEQAGFVLIARSGYVQAIAFFIKM